MKLFICICLSVLLIGAWSDQKTIPDAVEEARQEIKHAQEQIRRAEEILTQGTAEPGMVEKAKEKLKSLLSSSATPPTTAEPDDASILTKLRHYFKPEPTDVASKASTMANEGVEKAKTATKESAASLLEKLRHLFGQGTAEVAEQAAQPSAESLLERLRAVFAESEKGVDKLKGYGKEAMEKIEPKETLTDKVKSTLGLGTPSESLGTKIKNTFGVGTASESLGDKVKHALGVETPQETLGQKVKHAFGVETPQETLGEKIKSGVKSAIGVDSTTDVADKVRSALGVGTPTALERLRSYFGVQPKSTADKMRESLEQSIAQARANIENKVNAFRKATGSSRQSAYRDLMDTLEKAREDLLSRADTVYEAMLHPIETAKGAVQGISDKLTGEYPEETPGLLRRARDDMAARIHSLYDTVASISQGWVADIGHMTDRMKEAFGRGSSYLLQSSSYDDGITQFYVNDNGVEYLDVTGQNIDTKFDKLKALNQFRKQYNLPLYESFPLNVTVQTHPIKRAHVLIKSSRFVDGNEFDYIYDDGEETLNVIWAGEAPKMFTKEMQNRIIDSFRQSHGLVASPSSVPTVRARISHHARDEL